MSEQQIEEQLLPCVQFSEGQIRLGKPDPFDYILALTASRIGQKGIRISLARKEGDILSYKILVERSQYEAFSKLTQTLNASNLRRLYEEGKISKQDLTDILSRNLQNEVYSDKSYYVQQMYY